LLPLLQKHLTLTMWGLNVNFPSTRSLSRSLRCVTLNDINEKIALWHISRIPKPFCSFVSFKSKVSISSLLRVDVRVIYSFKTSNKFQKKSRNCIHLIIIFPWKNTAVVVFS
jgi:hypothetical protein